MTAAGLHTACAWMQCYVAANTRARNSSLLTGKPLPEIGPSPGFKNMQWLQPVFAGDVVSFFATAKTRRPLASRPGWGVVTGVNEGVNQQGALVFTFESAVLTSNRIN
jgi:acyl dehydratase